MQPSEFLIMFGAVCAGLFLVEEVWQWLTFSDSEVEL